jgi:hypothetical protein
MFAQFQASLPRIPKQQVFLSAWDINPCETLPNREEYANESDDSSPNRDSSPRFRRSLHSLYSAVHLKRNPQLAHMNPSCTKRWTRWQYWILAAVSRCCSWCTAWNRYGHNFSCFAARRTLVTDRHFLCPEMLSPVGVFLSYSILPCHDKHC